MNKIKFTRKLIGLDTYLYIYKFNTKNVFEVEKEYKAKVKKLSNKNKITILFVNNAFAFEARKLIVQ